MTNNEQELKDKAYNLHLQGKYDEAKAIYELILKENPNNLSVCFLYAELLSSVKEYEKAIELYKKVYDVTKSEDIKQNIIWNYFDAGNYKKALEVIEEIQAPSTELLKLKANIYLKLNNTEKAIEALKLLYDSDNTAIYALQNISLLYKECNKNEKAYEYALKVYEKDKNNIQVIMNLAEISEKLGYKDKLLLHLKEAEKLLPNNENILIKIAFVLEDIYNPQEALLYYLKLLKINPENYLATIKIAFLFLQIRDEENALKYIQKAEQIDADNYYNILAYCRYYSIKQNWQALLEYAKKLVIKDENNPDSYVSLYEAYYQLFDYDSALKCCEQAINKGLDVTDNICRKAVCLDSMNKSEEAFKTLDTYIDESSDNYKKIYSSLKLRNKRYEEGMKYYTDIVSPYTRERMIKEEGNKNVSVAKKFFEYYSKLWRREPLTNKTLLIHQGPHGLGDLMMFTRYIPLLEKMAGKIVLEVPENLYDLYKINFPNVKVVKETDEPYKDYDYSAASMDILYGMNMGIDNIPNSKGWLDVPQNLIENFEFSSIFNKQKKKIGIFWKGTNDIMVHRMAKLEEFVPLFDLEDCQFYSMDITEHNKETLEIFEKYNIIDCKKYIKNALDSAIILKNLDVFVTVDSFPLHLAGSIGVKTYLMLPGNAEWRWFKDTKTTPWYDSVRIFKQHNRPGWADVIAEIKTVLSQS